MEKTLKNKALLGYAVGLGLLVAAVIINQVLNLNNKTPLVLLLPAIAGAVALGGRGPGIFAAVLSAATVNFFFFGNGNSFSTSSGDLYLTFFYFIEGLITVYFIETIRRSRGEVWREREWFLTTLKSIDDAVIATDTSGCITFINPSALKMTEWSLEEVLKKKLNQVFHIYNADNKKK